MDHHTHSPQQQSYGPNCPKKLTVPYGSWHKQSTTTIWWTILTQKADCALRVIIQAVHNKVSMDHFDTDRDCARKTYGPWIIILTVRNNNLMEECEEDSSLCPVGHHTNSPQQQSEGPFWHKHGWLCQKDLSPMGHHTINAQQYNGKIWTKKLTVPYGSSYKESTTRFWWTILTQTVLTVAGRPKPHGNQCATTIWWTKLTQKLTVPSGSSYKQSTTRFQWAIVTQTELIAPKRPKAHGSSR